MCGIFIYKKSDDSNTKFINYEEMYQRASKMDHRGYSSCILKLDNMFFYHRRLAINDVSTNGAQPFFHNGIYLIMNGEIINSDKLKRLTRNYEYKSSSDCEVILPLYMTYGNRFITMLQGMFAGAIYDANMDKLIVFKDRYGIVGLYYGYTNANDLIISSELKSMVGLCKRVNYFPPGKILFNNVFINYRDEQYMNPNFCTNNTLNFIQPSTSFKHTIIRRLLTESVQMYIDMSDIPIGFLLSGGVDSSLVVSIASKYVSRPIYTFTIGLEGSTDIDASQEVVDFLNARGANIHHTAYKFSIEEAMASIEDVIKAVETYDITTIRASIPMYLLMKRIKVFTDIRVILSGEGADEIFSGYAYNKFAPSCKELHDESVDKINKLYMYDNLRSHKCGMANTIEVRPPFLYTPLVDYVMNIDPFYRHPKPFDIEKHILRESFNNNSYLPDNILWRKKEQFSDSVSSDKENLIERIKFYADSMIPDADYNMRNITYPYNTPISKEQYLYRFIYENYFKGCEQVIEDNSFSVACSTRRAMEWLKIDETSTINDPSGNSVNEL